MNRNIFFDIFIKPYFLSKNDWGIMKNNLMSQWYIAVDKIKLDWNESWLMMNIAVVMNNAYVDHQRNVNLR